MSVRERMTAIADAIREKTGITEPLSLFEMAGGVGAVYDAGVRDADAAHAARCFDGAFRGDGSRTASFEMPFFPDILVISNFSTEVMDTQNAIASVHYNRYSGGTLYAYGCISTGGNYYTTLMTAASAAAKITYAEGVLTVQSIGNATYPGCFLAGAEYAVLGLKLADGAAETPMTFALRRPADGGAAAEWEAEA